MIARERQCSSRRRTIIERMTEFSVRDIVIWQVSKQVLLNSFNSFLLAECFEHENRLRRFQGIKNVWIQ